MNSVTIKVSNFGAALTQAAAIGGLPCLAPACHHFALGTMRHLQLLAAAWLGCHRAGWGSTASGWEAAPAL